MPWKGAGWTGWGAQFDDVALVGVDPDNPSSIMVEVWGAERRIVDGFGCSWSQMKTKMRMIMAYSPKSVENARWNDPHNKMRRCLLRMESLDSMKIGPFAPRPCWRQTHRLVRGYFGDSHNFQ